MFSSASASHQEAPVQLAPRAVSLLEACRDSGAGEVWRSSPARASLLGLQNGLQDAGETRQIAVVNATVVELFREVLEQSRPVLSCRLQGDPYRHAPLDHLTAESPEEAARGRYAPG